VHFCHWTTSHLHFYCSVWMYKLAACVKVEPDAEMQNSLFYGLQKLVRDQTPAGGGIALTSLWLWGRLSRGVGASYTASDRSSTQLAGACGPRGNLSRRNYVRSITAACVYPVPARRRPGAGSYSSLCVNKWTSLCLPTPSKLVFIPGQQRVATAQYHQAYQQLVNSTPVSVGQFSVTADSTQTPASGGTMESRFFWGGGGIFRSFEDATRTKNH